MNHTAEMQVFNFWIQMIFGFIAIVSYINQGPQEGGHTTIIRKDKTISLCKVIGKNNKNGCLLIMFIRCCILNINLVFLMKRQCKTCLVAPFLWDNPLFGDHCLKCPNPCRIHLFWETTCLERQHLNENRDSVSWQVY